MNIITQDKLDLWNWPWQRESNS